MDGQVFLWAVAFAVGGFWLFYKLGNVLLKGITLLLALGGLYTSMVFWKEMDPVIAIGIVALAVIIAGGSMLFKKKGKPRNEGEIPLGIFLFIIGIFAFLTVIGALSSGEGLWKMIRDFFVSGADVVRELWERTDRGIEEVNR